MAVVFSGTLKPIKMGVLNWNLVTITKASRQIKMTSLAAQVSNYAPDTVPAIYDQQSWHQMQHSRLAKKRSKCFPEAKFGQHVETQQRSR